jgi:large subunit ribosomal protein L16
MLQPKKLKYRKQFRGKLRGTASRRISLEFGEYGLKAKESGHLTARQIEAARRAITHHTRRGGRVWMRIFPDKPVTKKPNEVGMGGGKGDVAFYVAPVKRGTVILEMGAVPYDLAEEAIRLASHKLPIKTQFITKEMVESK